MVETWDSITLPLVCSASIGPCLGIGGGWNQDEIKDRGTDFKLWVKSESELEVFQKQLSRVPTRAYLCKALLLTTLGNWSLLIPLALLLGR